MNLLRVGAVVRRHWIVLQRAPHRWFEISFWPVMDVLLWGALGVYVARQNAQSGASTPFLLAGITLFWTFTQAQFSIALGVNEETWTRNILNVFTTPIKEIEYIVGIAVFGLLKLFLCLLTLSVATAVFFSWTLADVGWIAIPTIGLLVINGWAVGLIAVGLVLRYGQSAEILIWGLNYMLMAFSGVFFPASAMPNGVRQISSVLPTTRIFATMRDSLNGAEVSWSAMGTSAVASLVFLALATQFAVHLLGVFRRRGFVTRYS